MTINIAAMPYADDYDKHKHFYKILFRPSYSLQTRELNQMQTMIQDQVKRMGDHLFKNGTMVIPGELSFDMDLHYVKLLPEFGSVNVATYISNLNGVIIKGATSGIRAQVITTNVATSIDPNTLYVKYLDGGTTGSSRVFADGETIAPEDTGLTGLNVTSATSSTGIGSAASVKEGVYYVEGYFVLCEPQLLILDKYTNTPTYHVGFNVLQTIVTPEQDETLLDNAQGSYNFAAPGAHRMSITLELVKKTALNDIADADDFIQLTSLDLGVIQSTINQTQYAELAKVMARRTNDESGDYIVNDFKYNIKYFRSDSRGEWAASTAYLTGDMVTHGGLTFAAISDGNSGSLGTAGTWPTDELVAFDDGGVFWRYVRFPSFNGGLHTVEQGGTSDSLALSISSGKAYVKGWEVEIPSTSYVALPRAREFDTNDTANLTATVGNYILVTGIHGIPDVNTLPLANIYTGLTVTPGSPNTTPGVLMGTARIRFFELHSGTPGSAAAIYKMGLFAITILSGFDLSRDAKQFYVNGGSVPLSFTADVSPVLTEQPGTVTCATNAMTGTGTTFSAFKHNDVISVNGTLYTISQASPITNDYAMTVTPTLTLTVGAKFYLVTTSIVEPANSGLLFPIDLWIKSVRSSTGTNETRYSSLKTYSGTTDSGGVIAFNLTGTGGSTSIFGSPILSGNYFATTDAGVIKDLTNAVVRSNGNKTITVTVPGIATPTAVIIQAAVEMSGTIETEKSKTLTYTSTEFLTAATGTVRNLTLPHADGLWVYAVLMKSGTWAAPTGNYDINISNKFAFDDGQTDSHYDLCKLILKDGKVAPTAPFKVIYSYFEHGSTGDYFTVNSYTNVPYNAIPRFANVNLAYLIDFRPRVSNDGTSFTTTGSSVSKIPRRGYNIPCAFSYYLGRIDRLCLEPSGSINLIKGLPSVSPKAPEQSATGMLLATITVTPYTASSGDIKFDVVDNKRYTMRDIGKLQTRIENLEYYTALTMTEQNTTNLDITDSAGLSRYKNGFIVDPFNGHGVGDFSSPDYNCAIDSTAKLMRPSTVIKNVGLYENDSTNRAAHGYTMTGDLITLPYTHQTLITQKFASRYENVNPFAVYTFFGTCNLNPETEDWVDTSRAPDQMLEAGSSAGAGSSMGTNWNSWSSAAPITVTTNSSVKTLGTTTSLELLSASPMGAGWGTAATYDTVKRQPDYAHQTLKALDGTVAYVQSYDAKGGALGYGAFTQDLTYGTVTKTTTSVQTTTAQVVNQVSIGYETHMEARSSTAYNGDRVISSTKIPYMRSRNVAFLTLGLKSNSKMYSSFEGIDVSAHVTPATKMILTKLGGFSSEFDYSSHSGVNAMLAARQMGINLDLALTKGFIVRGLTSSATAVVLYQEPLIAASTYINLQVINVTGTFQSGEVVVGSFDGGTTGSRGTLTAALTLKTKGSDLITNYAGVAAGVYTIPASSALSFSCGLRTFALNDVQNTTGLPGTSSATATYSAIGTLDTWQKSYTVTRWTVPVTTQVSRSQSVIVGTNTTTSKPITTTTVANKTVWHTSGYWDPLAQTFLVDVTGGAFITKVDLFFFSKETKLSTPVSIEIRDVVGGVPGNLIAPFSKVYLDPINVNADPSGQTATTFTFPSPIHLLEGSEYALVVMSDSNNYNVMISQMGELDIVTNKVISTQPVLGVLFKSSNGSSWEANQLQDLKFNLYRAKFATNTPGTIDFVNGPIDANNLMTDPLHFTNGSTLVDVYHVDHQMSSGSTVTISGVTGNPAGIPNSEINGNKVIANVRPNGYTISTTTAATGWVNGGGTSVIATENAAYDILHVNSTQLTFPSTTTNYSVKTTSGKSINGTETPYVLDSGYTPIIVNANVGFTSPRYAASAINEATSMSSAKSLTVRMTLQSSNDAVSPVIDMQRLSATLVSNKINAPTLANTNVNAIHDLQIFSGANLVGFDATYNSIYTATSNTATVDMLRAINAGKYIAVTGDVLDVPTAHTANNGDMLVIGYETISTNFHMLISPATVIHTIVPNVNNTIVITSHQAFIDETAPAFGSVLNKYMSREIVLAHPSTYLKVVMGASIPSAADVQFFYRVNPIGSTVPLADRVWISCAPNTVIPKNIITDVAIDVQNIVTFDSIQFKISMTSTSSSNVPIFKDLRIIACA